ncbi:MAG: DNA polymerase III subunit gamma/tau [Myxococcales bacterium]|nr:DNA polymerase III subunit gamma/tau [Myxococcales bacterium]
MSYLVLARKYRPQTFSDVIGQEHVTRTLQNAIRRGRIHHAFLFCGGRGTGKTTTARILAKALSCEKAPTPEPCNQCPACVEITNGTSVDVQEIDAASQNRVEDIRELRESIRYAPVRGKKKLYILDEVHMLSTSAFNALLKTLEEPPPHALFVFATTDPHKLPQTILSRVQRYDFKLVPTARLGEHLSSVLTKEGISFEPSAVQLVAREGQGSVRDSLSLLDQVLASTEGSLTEAQVSSVLGVADRGLIVGLGRAITERDPATALQLIDSAYGRGFDLSQLAKTLLGHLRDLLVIAVVKDPLPLLEATPSELEELRAQSERAKGRTEQLFNRMMRVADETSRAALPRYVLEVGVVELCAIEPMQPIGELVDRLEHLEDRLGSARPRAAGAGSSVGGEEPRPFVASTGRPAPRPESSRAAVGAAPASAVAMQTAPVLAPTERVAEHVAPAVVPMTTPVVTAAPSAVADAVPARLSSPSSVAEPASATVAAMPAPAVSTPAPAVSTPAPAVSSSLASSAGSALPDFQTVIAKVLDSHPLLAILDDARPMVWRTDQVVLGFETDTKLEMAELKRQSIKEALSSLIAGEFALDLKQDQAARPADPARWSRHEAQQQASTDDKMSRKREAEEHPARQLLKAAFGNVLFQSPTLLDEVS